MVDFSNANKGQLRQAMRDAGLSYDGLNVDGMRAALAAHIAPVVTGHVDLVNEIDTVVAPVVETEAPVVAPAPVEAPAPVAPAPLPVPKPARAEANGVKQPSVGTICRQIWDHCDGVYTSGEMPKAKALRAWGAGRLDDTTMTIQFYRWRKFRGISGRQA